jgi:hypothetical protein
VIDAAAFVPDVIRHPLFACGHHDFDEDVLRKVFDPEARVGRWSQLSQSRHSLFIASFRLMADCPVDKTQ